MWKEPFYPEKHLVYTILSETFVKSVCFCNLGTRPKTRHTTTANNPIGQARGQSLPGRGTCPALTTRVVHRCGSGWVDPFLTTRAAPQSKYC